ncbi:hypothetical protein M8J77_017788 [Diaphorina citri]|nr:hypothetical protein M8J77_017788 [Diaphorina citri]
MERPDQERHGKNQHHGRRRTRQNSLARQKWRGKKSSRLQMALAVRTPERTVLSSSEDGGLCGGPKVGIQTVLKSRTENFGL